MADVGVMVLAAGDVPGSGSLQMLDNETPSTIGGVVSM
jgi:hypothetical protein